MTLEKPGFCGIDLPRKRLESVENIRRKSPLELFGEFYEQQNGQTMSAEQSEFMENLIHEIWEAEE